MQVAARPAAVDTLLIEHLQLTCLQEAESASIVALEARGDITTAILTARLAKSKKVAADLEKKITKVTHKLAMLHHNPWPVPPPGAAVPPVVIATSVAHCIDRVETGKAMLASIKQHLESRGSAAGTWERTGNRTKSRKQKERINEDVQQFNVLMGLVGLPGVTLETVLENDAWHASWTDRQRLDGDGDGADTATTNTPRIDARSIVAMDAVYDILRANEEMIKVGKETVACIQTLQKRAITQLRTAIGLVRSVGHAEHENSFRATVNLRPAKDDRYTATAENTRGRYERAFIGPLGERKALGLAILHFQAAEESIRAATQLCDEEKLISLLSQADFAAASEVCEDRNAQIEALELVYKAAVRDQAATASGGHGEAQEQIYNGDVDNDSDED